MVRGEGSDGIADSIDSNVEVTRIHNASQEHVFVPRQRRGNEHLGSVNLGRMESNYTDEDELRSIAQDESKPDEVDDTPQERIVPPRQRRHNDHLDSPSFGRTESNRTDEPRSTAQAERKPDENFNTPQERVAVSTRLYGSDHLGSPRFGRVQSNYTDEPRSVTQAEHKPDENDKTFQERVVVPTRLFGSDRLGSPRFGRVQSNYTDEPRPITQAERKLNENEEPKRIERSPNTPKVTTSTSPVDRTEATRRMLYGTNARDATAPLTTFTTSTDGDERKPDENDDPKRIERSPNTPKVATSAGLVDRIGSVDRTEVTRRMLYDVHAHDVTAPSNTFTTSTDDDERKHNEINDSKRIERSPNTPKVSTTAGLIDRNILVDRAGLVDRSSLVDRTEITRRVLHDANAGDVTAPSTTSTTSTDHDDKGEYAEDDELEELLGSGKYGPPRD